jgi:hypothetical protein
MGSLDWRIDLLDNHQADLQILITLQNVTGTITHQVFNTSTLRCSLYEFGEQVCTQSLLFCLVLGLGFNSSVGYSSISLLHSSSICVLYSEFFWTELFWILYSGQFSRLKLASHRQDMKHSVLRYIYSFMRLSPKRLSLLCEQSIPIRCNCNASVRFV